MCGIAGILRPDGTVDMGTTPSAALETQSHRGPDDTGEVHLDTRLWLGHNRLSIIDIECGNQPMANEDQSVWLVFNGEIYNYVELRDELRGLGHAFHTDSDTEVIIHAYEQWGMGCQGRFNGMWAFALWDARRQRLLCSRDRFGVKPFAYARTHDGMVFASEIKTLLRLDPSLAVPAEDQVYRFLRAGLLSEGERTFFRDIRQLLAGHCLLVDADGRCETKRYYDPAAAIGVTDISGDDPAQRFRELLEDSVRLRLRSDVPVGTCLSGGLDSSSIVALMAGLSNSPIHTFTSIYPGTDSDESVYARAVAERFGAIEHQVEPSMRDFAKTLPSITWHQDAPTSAPGLYSQWHVMRLAQGNVKVLLDGQGGDEILGGYTGFYADYVAALLLDGKWSRLSNEWADIRSQLGQNPLVAAVRPLIPVSIRRIGRRMMRSNQLMADGFRAAWSFSEAPPVKAGTLGDPFNSSLYEALTRTTLPALLHYEDRDSMAFSVEARTPFLDHRLVEYCLALPYTAKMRGWETKVPLRDGMRDLLPAAVLDRRDKKGFPTPMAMWLRTGLMPWVREVLLSEEATRRGITNKVTVAKMLDAHEAGLADRHWDIWRLLTLELWYRSFIDHIGEVSA